MKKNKKIILSLFVLLCVFTITGCGSNKGKSYVMYEDGKKYTFEELEKISKENSISFKEKYCNVPGIIVAEVTKIKDYITQENGIKLLEIWLEGTDSWSNYVAKIDYDKYKDLIANLKTGDYLELTTNSIHCTFYTDFARIEVVNPNVEIVK